MIAVSYCKVQWVPCHSQHSAFLSMKAGGGVFLLPDWYSYLHFKWTFLVDSNRDNMVWKSLCFTFLMPFRDTFCYPNFSVNIKNGSRVRAYSLSSTLSQCYLTVRCWIKYTYTKLMQSCFALCGKYCLTWKIGEFRHPINS